MRNFNTLPQKDKRSIVFGYAISIAECLISFFPQFHLIGYNLGFAGFVFANYCLNDLRDGTDAYSKQKKDLNEKNEKDEKDDKDEKESKRNVCMTWPSLVFYAFLSSVLFVRITMITKWYNPNVDHMKFP